jgi:alpha-tubulin suppressor-like RCC1 family protein
MKKCLTRCAVAAALILIALLVMVLQPNAPGIQMGKPLPPGKVEPQLVNAGDMALLLAPDGSLWAWGETYLNLTNLLPQPVISQFPQRIGSAKDWTQVAGGWWHTVALKDDGSLWAWGWNGQGVVGQANLTNHYGTPTRIGDETNWTQVCAGYGHSLALKKDGSLWAWGFNCYGQLGDGTTNNRSIPIAIGTDRDWRTIAGTAFNSYSLKSNGTIWGWGYSLTNNGLAPMQIGPDPNWLAISACGSTVLALKTDGTLWIEGLNTNRVASDPLFGSREDFIQIGRDRDWAEVYATTVSLWAHKIDGSWWVCGLQQGGGRQLAVGTSVTEAPSPQRLPLDFAPWAFAPGQGTILLLGKDGRLWTWGRRLGAGQPSAARRKIEAFLAPAVKRFPALRFLLKSDIDQTPCLLWELPPEVRRSLGTRPKSATNNVTAGRPANAPARAAGS